MQSTRTITRRAVALAALACLLGSPAQAADRWWTYIGGCGSADWLGRVSGVNAEGRTTCWAGTVLGASGATVPTATDDVYIVNPLANSTLLTQFADPARPSFTARAKTLRMYGNTSFAAGLSIAAQSLITDSIYLGLQDEGVLGRIDQSGGRVSAQSLYVMSGQYNLSGGTLGANFLAVLSQRGASSMTQTGGAVRADRLYVSARFDQASAYTLQGGTLDTGDTSVGTFSTSQQEASMAVSGTSTRWTDMGRIVVGASGQGRVTIDAGARLQANEMSIGDDWTAGGTLIASGSGTAVGATGQVVVARRGVGRAQLRDGAAMAGSTLVVGAENEGRGSIVVGGQAATGARSSWSNTGGVTVGDAGGGELIVEDRGQFSARTLVLGAQAGGSGRVLVRNANTAVGVGDLLTVGDGGTGSLTMTDSATLRANGGITLGARAGSSGSVQVQGGATLTTGGTLAVGSFGAGALQIQGNGMVEAGAVLLGSSGTLMLDGGTLRTASFAPRTGSFTWTGGTLHLTAAAALDTAALPAFLSLDRQQTLRVDGGLVAGSGTVLRMNGGTVAADTLTLSGGTIVASAGRSLDLSAVGMLTGRGTVAAPVAGGTGSRIVASGGALTLGDLNSTAGYAYAGTLDTGSQQVLLLDRDLAQLGSGTLLAGGGLLATVNGARLGNGQALQSSGNAGVQGRFVNEGAVTATGGTLTFFDDVSGAGSYAGSIVFRAGFRTGMPAANVAFHGGAATFADTARLAIGIGAAGADQLWDIGRLQFDGTLALVFDTAYAPADGTQWRLFDFDSFAGSFDASRITVAGFDAGRLDISRLAIDGTLAVTAVPEPATVLLWLGGLALLAGPGRRGVASA